MRRLTDADLERLDRFLLERDDDEAMLLSTLDGFLSGIVVCPDLILPSEWLPAIWGGEGSGFTDLQEANEILGLIMARYNEIAHDLGRKGRFAPILDLDNDDSMLWEIWAEGFAAAAALRPDCWRVYDAAKDDAVRSAFHCLVALAGKALGEEDMAKDVGDEVRSHADRLIADCLETLNAARLAMPPAAPKAAVRVGRNDPCPCGSGKKFKKCCMN